MYLFKLQFSLDIGSGVGLLGSYDNSSFSFLRNLHIYCPPQWLYQFIFPPTVEEVSFFSTPSPALLLKKCYLFLSLLRYYLQSFICFILVIVYFFQATIFYLFVLFYASHVRDSTFWRSAHVCFYLQQGIEDLAGSFLYVKPGLTYQWVSFQANQEESQSFSWDWG